MEHILDPKARLSSLVAPPGSWTRRPPLHSPQLVYPGGKAMESKQPWQYYCHCGTRLAKDNSGHQCASCERLSRDKLIAPPEVPPEFWQTEQFRETFAAQHMGWVARAYRTHPYHHAVYGPRHLPNPARPVGMPTPTPCQQVRERSTHPAPGHLAALGSGTAHPARTAVVRHAGEETTVDSRGISGC